MNENSELEVVENLGSRLTLLGVAEVDPNRVRPFRPTAPSNVPKFGIVPVKANHFPVTFRPSVFPKTVYHYDVVITPKETSEVVERRGGGTVEKFGESTVPDRLLHVIWRTFEDEFHGRLGARMPFDGKKNCYSAKRLNFGNNSVWIDNIWMVDPDDDDRKRCYQIQLKLVNEIKTEAIFEYLRSCETWKYCELPQEVIQALDVALRYSPSLNYQPCNRSFYSNAEPHHISDLLNLWFGHNQSLLLGRDQRMTLNVDMANKAFFKRLPVEKAIRMALDIDDGQDMKFDRRTWTPAVLGKVEKFLKGKLIEYGSGRMIQGDYEKKHRFMAVKVIEHSSQTYKFTMNGKEVSIQTYFEREKGIRLRHPDWPVVHVGNPNMTNYVPMELCHIVPQVYKGKLEAKDTSEIIKGAAKPPVERFHRIQNSRINSKYEKCPILDEFGLCVGADMIDIPSARRIPKIQLQLRNEKGVEETKQPRGNDGKFQIGKVLRAAEVPKVGVLNVSGKLTAQHRDTIKRDLLTKLGFEAKNLGLISSKGPVDGLFRNAEYVAIKPRLVHGANKSQDPFHIATRDALMDFKKNGVGLVLVVMGREGNEYATVKNEAEVQVGILTQCLKEGTVYKVANGSGARQLLINILLKINAKLGGVNFQLGRPIMEQFNFNDKPILILGADVTHPAPFSNSPSVAAITASYDLSGVCFQMHIQVQPATEEVIHKLSHIIRSMIFKYYGKTRCKPERIIMFRDGVSEGQFPVIKEQEYSQGILEAVNLIREKDPKYNPKITFVVVKKRHHTRFLPLNLKDGVPPKQNIPPGTVVDTVITHPTEMEFFLNSHVGIQGTSKPTRYHVIHDDNRFSMEELEYLTYCLCYTFVRCTQPVSYPAPTYYAHLAAFRARALLEKEGDNADLRTLEQRMTIHKDLKEKYPMFYV